MWFACGFDNGLVSFNTKTKEIKNYKNIENDSTSLSFNSVNVIAIDSKNNLWLGTRYGLNKFNREDETFERDTEEDGLSNNFISGILVDGEDNLWISTNYGISNFEVSKRNSLILLLMMDYSAMNIICFHLLKTPEEKCFLVE